MDTVLGKRGVEGDVGKGAGEAQALPPWAAPSFRGDAPAAGGGATETAQLLPCPPRAKNISHQRSKGGSQGESIYWGGKEGVRLVRPINRRGQEARRQDGSSVLSHNGRCDLGWESMRVSGRGLEL